MSGYRRVNYYELCRLCTSSEGNRINIFRDEGRRRQLQTKIESYLPIQVHEEDSLPKVVCHDCVRKLDTYIEFRETVVSAESMLESYFTSLRFSDDFLKEGKVYVKTNEKERPSTPQDDHFKSSDKLSVSNEPQIVTTENPQPQHQQPVVLGNVNASNIQIISGVQARVQQYKCAMQMQAGGVAAAVVEATAETHYSYQQQTSQQLSPQEHSPHGQTRLNESQQQQQQGGQIHQVQNQIQSQSQMNQQLQSQRQVPQQQQQQQQTIQQSQIIQQQNQGTVVNQQGQAQINQQLHQLQRQQREFEKQQRQLQQMEKQQEQQQQQQQQQQQSQNQQIIQHQNNNVLLKSEVVTEQNQQMTLKVEAEAQNIGSPSENVQPTYATVQASPEVFLSLGLGPQSSQRDEVKEFKDYIKSDEVISRNSIGHISEFLRIRSCPENTAPLITVNPQAICQSSGGNEACGDCGKNYDAMNEPNGHRCPGSPMLSDATEITGKDENGAAASNGNCFSCDICGKPFKRKEHLFQHRKLHTGERPYVCTTCAKAFSRKEHLVRHSVSHTGQKMHECEMCGKSFSRKDNLHKHRKTHGVSGPYICETCGKSFVVKHYYLMHLTTHAPTVVDGAGVQDPLPHKCDICHKAFSVKQYLTTHKLRHRSKPNTGNANNQQQQQQQQQGTTTTGNDANATDAGVISGAGNITGNGQNSVDNPVVEIQSVIERNDDDHPNFENNQYHGNNVQQFQ